MAQTNEKENAMETACSFDAKQLATALLRVQASVAKKTALPVLTAVKIIVQDGNAQVFATNLESISGITIPATGTGAIVLEHAGLKESLPKFGAVAIEPIDDKRAKVSHALGWAEVNAYPADDYPWLRGVEGDPVIAFDDTMLRTLFGSVIHCAAKDHSRPVLSGLHVVTDETHIHVEAADGFRLARVSHELPQPATIDVLIPFQSLMALFKARPAGTVELFLDEHGASFRWDDGTLYSRLIQGTFPDTAKIIPTAFDEAPEAVVTADALRSSIEVIWKRARHDATPTRFKWSEMNGAVEAMVSVDHLAATTKIPVEAHRGEWEDSAFFAGYLRDMAVATKGRTLTMNQTGKQNIAVFRSEGFVEVIMPMVVGAS